ncbi:hypothetical protein [Vibrio chemaguriensis]
MKLVFDFIEPSFGELVFPIERLKNTPNFSSFYIEFEAYCDEVGVFEFRAVQNGILEKQYLYRLTHNLFVVHHVNYGDIYFGVSLVNEISKYVGHSQKVKHNQKFIRIFPLDNDNLNIICEFKKFFFVGYVDRNIERLERALPFQEFF